MAQINKKQSDAMIRKALLGTIVKADVEAALVSSERTFDKAASMAKAIAARRAELDIKPSVVVKPAPRITVIASRTCAHP
jgi:hypothetical protein